MSTSKTITYNTPLQSVFVHNALEVLIGTDAQLIARSLAADELFVATGRLTQAADLGASLPIFAVGTASHNTTDGYDVDDSVNDSYFSLNDDSGRDGITPLTPTSHFDFGTKGTIRFKITPSYSGNPPGTRRIFATGDSLVNNGQGSMIVVQHQSAGQLRISTRDVAGANSINSNFATWTPVSGTEVEIEINYDSVAGTSEAFVDGVSFGTQPINTSIGPRDLFYLGHDEDDTNNAVSEYKFKDIQIFNTIQHTANFASEVPRIVNLYPLESLIEPQDFSTSEGFLGFANSETLNGTSAIQYVMKINNSYYYLVAGVLTVSDQTLAQSSIVSDWTSVAGLAAVTAFISAGANITMIPILSSGPLGIYTPELVSDTLTYDFFAIPATCTDCVLYGFVNDNCGPITSGTVRVRTTKPILTQGHLQAFDETVNINPATGFFDIDLVIPNIPTDRGDTYLLEAKWLDEDGKSWSYTKKISIPNQASALLRDVVVL